MGSDRGWGVRAMEVRRGTEPVRSSPYRPCTGPYDSFARDRGISPQPVNHEPHREHFVFSFCPGNRSQALTLCLRNRDAGRMRQLTGRAVVGSTDGPHGGYGTGSGERAARPRIRSGPSLGALPPRGREPGENTARAPGSRGNRRSGPAWRGTRGGPDRSDFTGGAAGRSGRYEKWQADQWPGFTSRNSGSSREQMSCAM